MTALILFSSMAQAFNPDFGYKSIGITAGTLTSISGKFWFSKELAVDAGLLMVEDPATGLYADGLWHFRGALGKGTRFGRESLLYAGGGVGTGFWTRRERCDHWQCKWPKGETGTGNGFFVRGFGGAEWFPKLKPFGLFFETGPSYMLYPGGSAYLEINIGGRYYF